MESNRTRDTLLPTEQPSMTLEKSEHVLFHAAGVVVGVGPATGQTTDDPLVRLFSVHVPQAALDDLRPRIGATPLRPENGLQRFHLKDERSPHENNVEKRKPLITLVEVSAR